MRFNRNVSPELREALLEQLKEYKKEMKMSRSELSELNKWVSEGHSPYENGDFYYFEGGYPMDFVSALRFDRELIEMKEIYNTETESIVFIPQEASARSAADRQTTNETDEELPF